jgi:TPR repeat protein
MMTKRQFGFCHPLLIAFCAFAFVGVAPGSAGAQTRRAFVMGVQHYNDRTIQSLARSDNDAADVAADLEQVGFDKKNIILATDLRARTDFDKKFAAFLATVNEGDIVFFFFSGHGLGVDATNTNYLLLADLKGLYTFTRDQVADADKHKDDIIALKMPGFAASYETDEIPKNGVSANEILQMIGAKKPKSAIVILDACRSLAPPASSIREIKPSATSGSRLLPSKDLPEGSIVLFSASFGEQAIESLGYRDRGRNSLFTQVLRSEMQRPGQTLVGLAERTRLMVKAFANSAGYPQEPEYFENLGSADNLALVDSIGAERFAVSQQQCDGAQADWEQISQQPQRAALLRHRKRFHDCATAELARRALVNIANSADLPASAPVASVKQIDDCDRLAASDNDPARSPEVPGVGLAAIDFDAAIEACKKSIQRNVRIVRYLYNLGRAEQAAANSMLPDDPARKGKLIEARAAFDDATKRGYVAALYSLATLNDFSESTEQDQERANTLLKEAATQGYPPAMYELGLRNSLGTFGFDRNLPLAYEWLGKAAESGSVAAMTDFARALWYGSGVENNPRRAVEWAQRAAEAGYNRAKFILGDFYYYGYKITTASGDTSPNSVQADDTQALLWYGRAAADNNATAQFNLAYMMERGYGLPNPQPEIAERYYRLAAHGGDEDAEIELAERLLSGRVLTKPENGATEAIDLLSRAFSQGSARASLDLARIYRDGQLGEPKNPAKAMQYAFQTIRLSVQADPTTIDGNPFFEIAAGILLAEMAKNGQANDVNDRSLLSQDEVDRLERFYGKVDDATRKVRVRNLQVPFDCGGISRYYPVWVWDWGRVESPTEPQFRSLEREKNCYVNDVLRRTLIASFAAAKKNKVAFADLIEQQINAAKARQDSQPQTTRKR